MKTKKFPKCEAYGLFVMEDETVPMIAGAIEQALSCAENKQKKRIASLEKEVALLHDVEVHLQICENNKKALVDICEQYKQENKRLKAELSK
jgi:hypothetical protein